MGLVAALLETGAAVVVATVDAHGRPSVTRGWGASVSGDGYVVVCLTAPDRSGVRADLATTGRIAVTVVDPLTYASAQLKGTVDALRQPTEAESDLVELHVRRFAESVATVGIADGHCMMLGDLLAVGFHMSEAYDQTPGHRAGRALA